MKWEQLKNWPWKRIMMGTAVLSSIAASTSFGTYAYFTSAAESPASFTAGKLEIRLGETKALFQADDDQPFMPGVRVEKTLIVENNSDVPVKYALLAEKEDGEDIVYNQLVVEIRREDDDELLYHGRVSTLSQANVVIPELPTGESDRLRYTVYLPESTGNEVQQKSASVSFGFLATQQENGGYFAQSGPVMTFTPQDLSGQELLNTMKLVSRVEKEEGVGRKDGDAVRGMTFVLGEGRYDLSGLDLPKNVTWKAAPGKEGKVIIEADELEVSDTAFEGIRFEGSGTGLLVGSNVTIRNSIFDSGFEAAIRTSPKKGKASGEEAEDGSYLEGLTVMDSIFEGPQHAIVLDEAIRAVLIANNTFEGGDHAIVVANDKATQVQIVGNDFSGVGEYAIDSNGVRVGDGIDGFKEIKADDSDAKKLALHLHKADFYLENNKYSK